MLKVLAGYPVKRRRRRANSCSGTGLLGSARIASRAATTWDVVSMASWCIWSMIHRSVKGGGKTYHWGVDVQRKGVPFASAG